MKSKYINIHKMIGRGLAHNKCYRNTYLIKAKKKSCPSSSKFLLLEARVQACYPGSTIEMELRKCWIWNWVWGNWSCGKCGDRHTWLFGSSSGCVSSPQFQSSRVPDDGVISALTGAALVVCWVLFLDAQIKLDLWPFWRFCELPSMWRFCYLQLRMLINTRWYQWIYWHCSSESRLGLASGWKLRDGCRTLMWKMLGKFSLMDFTDW